MVHHGLGIVDPDDALGCLLHILRGVPGVVDILGRKAPQNRQVTPEDIKGIIKQLRQEPTN